MVDWFVCDDAKLRKSARQSTTAIWIELTTRSGDSTKHTKLHFVDKELRTWMSCPGSWSQFCMVPSWAPIHNWVTNKELKNMEKDFVVILCLSASKVLSLVLLGGISMRRSRFAQQAGVYINELMLSICHWILNIDAFKIWIPPSLEISRNC